LKHRIRTILEQAVRVALAGEGHASVAVPDIELEIPRRSEHGDFSTNIALKLARPLGMVPRELALAIVDKLQASSLVERAETAGPGFINLHVATRAFMDVIERVLESGSAYGRSTLGAGRRVQIEFVSANPTGPLHVGHGRGAAYGAVLANIFVAAGYAVSREYYVNDAGRQMDILATSLLLRYLQACGQSLDFPGNAYQGDYIATMARILRDDFDERFVCRATDLMPPGSDDADPETALDELIARCKSVLGTARYAELHRFGRDEILAGIEGDLRDFGVEFDSWFSESTLVEDGRIEEAVTALDRGGHVYTKDGAQWFKSTAFGDEKDRVVVRENGAATYFASDIAYHADKYRRGFDRLINIWGADHHGYVSRVKAAVEAVGLEAERLEVLLVQFAVLYRRGDKMSMSTRSGEFVTLAELVAEVGRDAARFFYITRRSDQHLDFDLDLAKSESNDNPVYYVQYAHARICSVLAQLAEKGYVVDTAAGLAGLPRLDDAKEKRLAVQLSRYPETLESAVRDREPHLITVFLRELAADFHGYYNSCRIITDDTAQRNARLALILAVKQVLGNGLDLLGVSAPEAM
jgi:arginyl-tRNA synthetase